MANPLDQVMENQRDDGNPLQRVYINGSSAPGDGTPFQPQDTRLTQAVAPETGPVDIMALIEQVKSYINSAPGTGNAGSPGADRAVNRLLGTGGEERYQMWPEKMVRSALAAPGEALASTADNPVTSENAIAPAQDIAGMASGSTLFTKPGVGTLGSGPLRPGAKAMPTVAEATQWAKEAVAATGERWENYTPAQQQEWVRRGYDQLAQKASRDTLANPAPVFYSALEHATTNAAQDVMSPQQWLGYLKNQPGVKAEELAWTGLPEWLGAQKGKVKKQDVQAYLDEHKVEIKDVTKTERDIDSMTQQQRASLADDWREFNSMDDNVIPNRQDLMEHLQLMDEEHPGDVGAPKYSSYQLPGGENYREHLLTLPPKTATSEEIAAGKARTDESGNPVSGDAYKSSHWDEPNVLAHVRTNDRVMEGEAPKLVVARRMPDDTVQYGKAGQIHSDLLSDKELLAGLDKNTGEMGFAQPGGKFISRSDAIDFANKNEPSRAENANSKGRGLEAVEYNNGDAKPVKSLHIEEIQSDWHQQGRKQGYKDSTPIKPEDITVKHVKSEVPEGHDPKNYPGYWESYDKDGGLITRHPGNLSEAQVRKDALASGEIERNSRNKVPDAPFKTTWPELALKRMIRHAAENGYDRISWTPGEAQAARYDLSKTIDSVWWSPEGHMLQAYKDGKVVMNHEGVPAEKLADYVGKEAAEKLVNSPTKITDLGKAKRHELSGLDLKVGGEGMREFYDKMLPKMAEKIGKAHGVKVKQTQLRHEGGVSGEDVMDAMSIPKKQQDLYWKNLEQSERDRLIEEHRKTGGPKLHYFDLPPSLRDHAVGKGFPLYMSGIPFPLTPVDHDPFKKDK